MSVIKLKSSNLSQNDLRELKLFERYLKNLNRFGMDALLRRAFWRKYLNVNPPQGQRMR